MAAADGDRISVVLADDHVVVRRGLRMLLEQEADVVVVAEAGDADEAAGAVTSERPGVLVLDLNMPGAAPLDALRRVREAAPETAVVVLTMEQDPAFARQALEAGAAGYLLKQAVDEELVRAIRGAVAGEVHVSTELRLQLEAGPDEPPGPPGGLSERELEVLRLIALGHTNPEIAKRLGISVRTVETHRTHLHQKLGVDSRAQLVRYAFDNDLVPERRSARRS